MSSSLQEPQPGHDKSVVGPRVTQLMPPILPDDLVLINLVVGPEVSIALFVQIYGLENMPVKVDLGRELGLVVGAVETHL